MGADFTHLHLHTQFSLLDGAIRLKELFQAASDDKMDAVAITDHGNMFGVLDFYHQAKEHGIKPILGCEVYIAPQSRHMKGTHYGGESEVPPWAMCESGLHHLVLLCQNEIGYKNLCKIVSKGYLEGFYYKPRVDKELLSEFNEGLIATSACLKGEVTHQALLGDMDRAREAATWYKNTFKDRFYLEMQHNDVPQQMIVNQRFQQLAKDLEIPLIASADCHYVKREDAGAQDVLMKIQTGRQIEDPHRIQPPSDQFYFKPQAVIKEEFSHCPEAIENTMKIANQCNFEFKLTDETGKKIYHYPKFDPPPGQTLDEHLIEQAKSDLEVRIKEREKSLGRATTEEERKAYDARLKKELDVILEMGFTGYFLIVSDFIKAAKERDIPVGPGRGSGAGSLVAYALKITDLDPLDHGLLFERFLNPERVSLPDFDVDFCMDKRDEIIQYVVDKYGTECVAQIITFGKLQARGVIRDVGRVFGMAATEVDPIAKLVPNTLNITLEEAFETEPRLRTLEEKDPKLAKLFEICRALEGLYRHASIHAAGLVISNQDMVEHAPLYRGKDGELVIQFDMNNADRVGLIKFDFLGLKTLTFLQHSERLVQKRFPDHNFRLDKIDINDPIMYRLLKKGDTYGIFQLESSGMQDLLRRVRPERFGDIVAINALYRPGPIGSGMLDDFIGRKHGTVSITYDFEILEPILEETYGIIVYQEQVQQIAVNLAGYTLGGADILRRAMGKKKPEEMVKQKAIFMEGAKKNNYDEKKSEKLFELMAKFAGYGFNKSHAAAYALIACQTAFLKSHYPVEFYAGLLTIERENTDKITRYIADARKHGIKVLPPDINESETDFTVLSDKMIRFGFGAIKGVGQVAIDSVIEAREKDGPFTDLFDLCSRVNVRLVNKRVLEAFTKAGALDSFGIHRASLMATIDQALEMGSSLQKTRDDNQSSFMDLLGEEENSFAHRKVSYEDKPKWERLQELKYEKDTTGFFISGHPLEKFQTELKRYTTHSIGDLTRESSSKGCMTGAQVSALREIITKRGDRMAFATMEDELDQLEVVIFSDVYVENEETFKCGEPIWVKGQLEVNENGNKILLSGKNGSQVLPLRYAYEAMARELHVHLGVEKGHESVDQKHLAGLQEYLAGLHQRDGAPVYLHLELEGQSDTVLRLKQQVPIKRDIVQGIQDYFGDKAKRIDFS